MLPSEVFIAQMRIQRERRGWSQRELASRLGRLGLRVHQTTIGKWEAGERRLDLDEALAICAALDVSPVHMISGSYLGPEPDDGCRIALSDQTEPVRCREMRMWIRGERPAWGQDEKRFATEVAPEEWRAMQRAGVRELRADVQLLVAAWADGDLKGVLATLDAMGDELERQRRALERQLREGRHAAQV